MPLSFYCYLFEACSSPKHRDGIAVCNANDKAIHIS